MVTPQMKVEIMVVDRLPNHNVAVHVVRVFVVEVVVGDIGPLRVELVVGESLGAQFDDFVVD